MMPLRVSCKFMTHNIWIENQTSCLVCFHLHEHQPQYHSNIGCTNLQYLLFKKDVPASSAHHESFIPHRCVIRGEL